MSVLDTTTYDVGITLDGAPVDPAMVVCDVTIRSGRSRQDDGIEPASCTIEILSVASGGAAEVDVTLAQLVQITVDGQIRFTGRTSEISRTPTTIGEEGWTWTIVAVGNLARLARFTLTPPIPRETAAARALRIIQAVAGGVADIRGGAGYELAAYGASTDPPVHLDQILGQLVADTGAVVQDMPDGSTMVQFADGRLSADLFAPDPTVTSSDLAFAQSDDVINEIIISYGNNQDMTLQAPASITQYDLRSVSLDTQLDDNASATTRAESIISRLAWPSWGIDSLTTWDRDFLNHEIGAVVQVSPLPVGAPVADPWQGVMEGYVEHYQPSTDGSGRVLGSFLLAIGDLQHSAETIHWAGVTPSLTWAGVDPQTAWNEAISNAALTP